MNYELNKIYSEYSNVHYICREVLDVSNQSEIQAVLIGGSLLGMVRDGDFLPWDKDLDFAVFEDDIDKTIELEADYRKQGYECRVHHLGLRASADLDAGLELIGELTQIMQNSNIAHCLIGGALLNVYRDKRLFPEIDTLACLIAPESSAHLDDLIEKVESFGQVFVSKSLSETKSITLITPLWRVNFFLYIDDGERFGWRDLNCEHWFDQALFPSQKLEVSEQTYYVPANPEQFLAARFGDNWHARPQAKFQKGRVVGSMQLYKDGVMFDFIMHYVRGDKTYWYEPAANVISTIGFLPCSIKSTSAGDMLFPDNPEVFLQEHYPNWQVPVKKWNGAVDNPTIIDSDVAMQNILAVGS
jgi:hypothetical protein